MDNLAAWLFRWCRYGSDELEETGGSQRFPGIPHSAVCIYIQQSRYRAVRRITPSSAKFGVPSTTTVSATDHGKAASCGDTCTREISGARTGLRYVLRSRSMQEPSKPLETNERQAAAPEPQNPPRSSHIRVEAGRTRLRTRYTRFSSLSRSFFVFGLLFVWVWSAREPF